MWLFDFVTGPGGASGATSYRFDDPDHACLFRSCGGHREPEARLLRLGRCPSGAPPTQGLKIGRHCPLSILPDLRMRHLGQADFSGALRNLVQAEISDLVPV